MMSISDRPGKSRAADVSTIGSRMQQPTPASLFGGPVSTRHACTDFAALQRAQEAAAASEVAVAAKRAAATAAGNGKHSHGKASGGGRASAGKHNATQHGTHGGAPVSKKIKLDCDLLDFDDLNDSGPRSAPKQQQPGKVKGEADRSAPQLTKGAAAVSTGVVSGRARGAPLRSLPAPPAQQASTAGAPPRHGPGAMGVVSGM
jgi:hypothetical protein